MTTLQDWIQKALTDIYGPVTADTELSPTKKNFPGDLTWKAFPLAKTLRTAPAEIARKVGEYLVRNAPQVKDFNVAGGFLNILLDDAYYVDLVRKASQDPHYGIQSPDPQSPKLMVEYSSPNTNKPLHLGHIRNNLLGYAVSRIYEATGKPVIKTQIINDRGIHICKSMLAWQKFGHGETPESSGLKGDHLVGKYYVIYNEEYKKELKSIKEYAEKVYDFLMNENNKKPIIQYQKKYFPETTIDFNKKIFFGILGFALAEYFYKNKKQLAGDITTFLSALIGLQGIEINEKMKEVVEPKIINEEAYNKYQSLIKFLNIDEKELSNKSKYEILKIIEEAYKKQSPILLQAQEMLRKWEEGDPEVRRLWQMMNGWVLDGFRQTYRELGVDFDVEYFESETYLLGKKIVEQGLEKGIFYRKADGSVWVDLTDEGLGEKLLLRADGTSVYITQDLGTAVKRFEDFDIDMLIYVVGNEQDYHFKVLFSILKKLGYPWAERLYHLSYGMVELPSGKMKSREGTVVDADDLMHQMTQTARRISEELGKTEGLDPAQKEELYRIIGEAALKYYILKVDPKKGILFDPEKSIDFNGNTGPFLQYAYVRIQSILRKAGTTPQDYTGITPNDRERLLIRQLEQFPQVIGQAAQRQNPALVANYLYETVRHFNSFYQAHSILQAPTENLKNFRLDLARWTARVIRNGLDLLGIRVPQRM